MYIKKWYVIQLHEKQDTVLWPADFFTHMVGLPKIICVIKNHAFFSRESSKKGFVYISNSTYTSLSSREKKRRWHFVRMHPFHAKMSKYACFRCSCHVFDLNRLKKVFETYLQSTLLSLNISIFKKEEEQSSFFSSCI